MTGGVTGGVTFDDFEDPNEDRSWDLDCDSIQGVECSCSRKESVRAGCGGDVVKLGLALKGDEFDETLRKDEDHNDSILDTENGQLVGKFSPDN